ncbi:MAG: hypothetical protein SGI98_03925 [Verrucomicrobiota bacterium]|nr:hypothetical protein [Verrucomicrobiota bacterium]
MLGGFTGGLLGFTDNFQLGPVVSDEVKLVPPVCLVFMFADNFQLGPVVVDEVKLVSPVCWSLCSRTISSLVRWSWTR